MLLWLTYNRHSVKAVGSLLELLVPSQSLIRFFPLMAQKKTVLPRTPRFNQTFMALLWVPRPKHLLGNNQKWLKATG